MKPTITLPTLRGSRSIAAGTRAYIASGGSDVVSVVDLARLEAWLSKADERTRARGRRRLTLSAEYVLARIPTGRNPRHLALSPDGKTLFVAERLQDSVLVIDTANLQAAGPDCSGRRRDETIRSAAGSECSPGRRILPAAVLLPLVSPDGHVDGLSYDFDGDGMGDNLLDNRSLQGVAGTAAVQMDRQEPQLWRSNAVRGSRGCSCERTRFPLRN